MINNKIRNRNEEGGTVLSVTAEPPLAAGESPLSRAVWSSLCSEFSVSLAKWIAIRFLGVGLVWMFSASNSKSDSCRSEFGQVITVSWMDLPLRIEFRGINRCGTEVSIDSPFWWFTTSERFRNSSHSRQTAIGFFANSPLNNLLILWGFPAISLMMRSTAGQSTGRRSIPLETPENWESSPQVGQTTDRILPHSTGGNFFIRFFFALLLVIRIFSHREWSEWPQGRSRTDAINSKQSGQLHGCSRESSREILNFLFIILVK